MTPTGSSCSPRSPADGNGLAMRAKLFRRSAPVSLDVQSVVVPVAEAAIDGRAPGPRTWLQTQSERGRERSPSLPTEPGASGSRGSDRFRRRLASPRRAGDAVVQAVSGDGPVALHVVRAYMAPLGVAVAERLEAVWATLELDEDDSEFARSAGDLERAAAYERLLEVFGPLFDGLSAASAGEAVAIGERHGLPSSTSQTLCRWPRYRCARAGRAATRLRRCCLSAI